MSGLVGVTTAAVGAARCVRLGLLCTCAGGVCTTATDGACLLISVGEVWYGAGGSACGGGGAFIGAGCGCDALLPGVKPPGFEMPAPFIVAPCTTPPGLNPCWPWAYPAL